MRTLGIVLVHGYTGRPDDLEPLAQDLCNRFGDAAVTTVQLPGHDDDGVPVFDAGSYENIISEAVAAHRIKGHIPVLVGHSTGGSLAVGYLLKAGGYLAMLILAAAPSWVKGEDLCRWEHHRGDHESPGLVEVARMVSYINRVGSARHESTIPVHLLAGGIDTLVPLDNAKGWKRGQFKGPVHSLTIPGAAHDLFHGTGGQAGIDYVVRTLSDLAEAPNSNTMASVSVINEIEAGASEFMAFRSSRAGHLVRSPSALKAIGQLIDHTPVVKTDPMQLNIEITSRCNLACGHCARSRHTHSGHEMGLEAFKYLLDLLPNTYRIVFVGLGEPTLHPRAAEFVALAARRGHHVGMVTNATGLEGDVSKRLIDAGLRSLTFSLDTIDADLVARIRAGSDLDRIVRNVENFMGLAGKQLQTAVFTGVSIYTVHHLQDLADAIADFGVDAWMLSDMNFHTNLEISIWKNWDAGLQESIGKAVKRAYSRNLPVLSVRGVEVLGMGSCYRDYLISAPAELARRSGSHRHCLSPWQTLPVDVDGNVTVCDCQPDRVIGNLYEKGLSKIWNGAAMQAQRSSMRSKEPLEACCICPRF